MGFVPFVFACHLLSLRGKSEPAKKSKKPTNPNRETDTFQKPLESLSGNLEILNSKKKNVKLKKNDNDITKQVFNFYISFH